MLTSTIQPLLVMEIPFNAVNYQSTRTPSNSASDATNLITH